MNEKLWEGKMRRHSVFKGREESSSVSVCLCALAPVHGAAGVGVTECTAACVWWNGPSALGAAALPFCGLEHLLCGSVTSRRLYLKRDL